MNEEKIRTTLWTAWLKSELARGHAARGNHDLANAIAKQSQAHVDEARVLCTKLSAVQGRERKLTEFERKARVKVL